MFLKKIFTHLLIVAICLPTTSRAASPEVLEAGAYKLTTGNKDLCMDFQLSKSQLKAKELRISSHYAFYLKSEKSKLPSDLDEKCVFDEESSREDTGIKQTVLKRINKEICSGKVRSSTTSILTLTRGEMVLSHKVDGAEAYECIWKKK